MIDDGVGVLYYNPAGIRRSSFSHETLEEGLVDPSYSWSSRFSSVSFNQYGRGFPNGGMNERGLAIEVLWLNETEYTAKDERPYLNELEWVQYILDTCETVKDVKTRLSEVRISPIHGQVHYFFCDRIGDCGVLEFIKGVQRLYLDDLKVPSLTNHSYKRSIDDLVKQRKKLKSRNRDRDHSLGLGRLNSSLMIKYHFS